MDCTITQGDARHIERDDCSIDSCVTDPPYEFAFMGKSWDASGIAYSVEMWREVLRVLKPGAHLLAFGGTRTFHRMVCAIEDAGFEIRDSIQWIYGSGFPKSLDVGKALDGVLGTQSKAANTAGAGDRQDIQGKDGVRDKTFRSDYGYKYEPQSDAAKLWDGWGTALKPAHEIICLARKPLSEPTVAANVLRWGTGAINIDATRINPNEIRMSGGMSGLGVMHDDNWKPSDLTSRPVAGRWPSNIILSHSPNCDGQCTDDCPVRLLDEQSGELTTGGGNKANQLPLARQSQVIPTQDTGQVWSVDKGGASRFFRIVEWDDLDFLVPFYYCAKASRSERNQGCETLPPTTLRADSLSAGIERKNGKHDEARKTKAELYNSHPTVKPVSLLRYLCRLITPENGMVIDPFMGSGSTGVAADKEGFNFIGIEKEAEYVEIAKARIKGKILPLFN